MISLMDAIYFTLLFKALVILGGGGVGGGHKYISMSPSMQSPAQMLLAAAPCIWKTALVMRLQRGKVLL